jgi:phage terminase large subunit-like protein
MTPSGTSGAPIRNSGRLDGNESRPRWKQNDWLPAWQTARRNEASDGADVADFAGLLLRVSKGFKAGEPLVLTDWQRWLIDALLERNEAGRRRYRRALIGLPRKNGKSLLGSALALYGLFVGERGAEVYSAAGDRQQARIVFGEAKQQVLDSPALRKVAKVYRDAIEVPAEGAVYRVLSADAKLQQGLNPSLVIFDEVHVQPNDDLWDALTLGSGARRDPLVVGITTAGYDLETLCGRLYLYGQQVARGEIDDPAFGFWWWESPEGSKATDEDSWFVANPNLAEGLLDIEDMRTSVKQTARLAFDRYRRNQWTRASDSWLPAGAWDACRDGTAVFDPSRPFWAALDMALKHDTAALVTAQEQDGRFVVRSQVWKPRGDVLDVQAIEQAIRALHATGQLQGCTYDPAYFERSAQVLADDGIVMIEFPQTAQRMNPACGNAYELISGQRVAHDGDPTLTDHVLSAEPRASGEGWRLSKGKARRKIDACIALVMALDVATGRVSTPRIFGWDDVEEA